MESLVSGQSQDTLKVNNLTLAFVAKPEPSVEEEASHSFWSVGIKLLEIARGMTLLKADPSVSTKLDKLFQAMNYRHNRLYQAFKKERHVRCALEKRCAFLEALLSAQAISSGRMIETSLRSEKLSPMAAENKALKDMLKEAELELIRYRSLYRDSVLKSIDP